MFRRLRISVAGAVVVGLALALTAPATAQAKSDTVLPTTINLPNGFQPEGIAIGVLPFAFFGSRATGDLFRVNLVNGQGAIFSKGPGTASLGMKLDLRGRLFVAGGTGGDARVVNAVTGDVLASFS